MPNADPSKTDSTSLPLVADCEGCGVCCLHMGYPAFILPRAGMSDQEIDADPKLAKQAAADPKRREELRAGNPGESYWHALPEALRAQWEAFVASYQQPEYGDDPATFDGPCIWFNLETRQCGHHEHRPRICRDFETGSPECYEWRNYYRDKISLNSPEEN
ncbi:MAG: Fe-S-cluster containining protein [Mariniblastus sp.]|jgi:Fe-S-cluster containining protein